MNYIHKITLWGLSAAFVLTMLSAPVKAANGNPVALDVHVSINATKDVTVNTTSYSFGAIPVSSSVVSASSITVTNTGGGIIETYTMLAGNAISQSAGTNWTLQTSSTAVGSEQYAIAAQFSDTQPAGYLENSWVSDYLTTVAQAATSTVLGNGNSAQSGAAVTPNGVRGLWFRMRTPTSTADPGYHVAAVTLAVQ